MIRSLAGVVLVEEQADEVGEGVDDVEVRGEDPLHLEPVERSVEEDRGALGADVLAQRAAGGLGLESLCELGAPAFMALDEVCVGGMIRP